MKLLFEQHRSWLGRLLGEPTCWLELSTVESLARMGVAVKIDRVIISGGEDGKWTIERADSEGGADGAQDVVRCARQNDVASSDGTHPHLQCPPSEDGRGGNGEAVPEHRAGGASEGSGVQGAGPTDGGGFRAELERRAADGGDGKLTEFRLDEALIDVDIVGSRLFASWGFLDSIHERKHSSNVGGRTPDSGSGT